MPMAALANRKVLVTGGSRGIGRAIALRMAEAGADVVVTYNTKSDMASIAAEDISALGRTSAAVQMIIPDRESIREAIVTANKTLDGLDVLVNNAGINKPTDFDEISDDDWDSIIGVNLKGPFICSQEALPYLKRSDNASIINIGSVSGQYGGPRTAHYAASKAGLISLSQVIARFGASDGIRCNTIAAGLIDSEMAAAGLQSGAVAQAAENIVLKRMGSPNEVADAAIFLASDQSSYITAQTINVNGGLYF